VHVTHQSRKISSGLTDNCFNGHAGVGAKMTFFFWTVTMIWGGERASNASPGEISGKSAVSNSAL